MRGRPTEKMRAIQFVVLLLAAAVGTASAAGGKFNWFPDAVHANCTTGDCSFPSAWSAANQSAAAGLGGGPSADGLLTIAIKDYFPLQPEIYFVPGAWCDNLGGIVPLADIEARLPPPLVSWRLRLNRRRLTSSSASRAMLQDPATTAVDTVEVVNPCDLSMVDARIGAAGTWQAVPVFDAATGVYRLALGTDLPDGVTCIDVRAIYATSAFATVPAYTDLVNGTLLPATTAFTEKVCLFKFARQAAATIKFDMCTTGQFTVNVSAVSPLPVNVTRDGAPVGAGANLLRPLIKVWGGKTKELDGTPSSELYDESAAHSQETWISKYLLLPSSYAGETLSFPLSGGLQEGYYNVSSTVSLITAYPSLVSLVGLNQITQDDESGVSSGVTGLWEAATLQLHDHVQVGVQKASTPTTLSAIACTSHPVSRAVAVGDAVVLTWQFNGIGSATCKHDGEVVSNAAGGTCASPLTITARAFSAAAPTHKLVVTFSDVCGRARTAEFDYTAQGVDAVTPTEVVDADGTVQVITTNKPSTTVTASTGAAGVRSSVGSGLVATAAGAAALLLLLA